MLTTDISDWATLDNLFSDDWYNLYEPMTKLDLSIGSSSSVSVGTLESMVRQIDQQQTTINEKFDGFEDLSTFVDDLSSDVDKNTADISICMADIIALNDRIADVSAYAEDTSHKVSDISTNQVEIIEQIRQMIPNWVGPTFYSIDK